MTIRHLYPAAEPSLNLDFANSKRLDPRITFTRLSIGTYTDENGIIRTAADNEARFDHDSDGNSLGLLIEESRTNYFPYSESLSTSAIFTGASFTSTTESDPSNGSNACTLTEDTGTSTHRFNGYFTDFANGGTGQYSYTFFAKPNGRTKCQIKRRTSFIDLFEHDYELTGEGVASGGGVILKLSNGWYKLTGTFNVTNTSNTGINFALADGTGNVNYTGDGTSGMILFGKQIEKGSFPTSYVPTTSSTLTRSADIASMTGTNFSSWYNQSEGTVFIDLPTNLSSVGNNDAMFSFHNGSTNRVNPQWVTYSWFWLAAGTQVAIDPYVSSTSTAGKYAFSFDSSNIAATYNGQTTNTVTSSSLVQDVTGLRFFTEWNGGRQVYGHISRFAYYPVRLTDEQLQTLTL